MEKGGGDKAITHTHLYTYHCGMVANSTCQGRDLGGRRLCDWSRVYYQRRRDA